jgi:hypothetical protein
MGVPSTVVPPSRGRRIARRNSEVVLELADEIRQAVGVDVSAVAEGAPALSRPPHGSAGQRQ